MHAFAARAGKAMLPAAVQCGSVEPHSPKGNENFPPPLKPSVFIRKFAYAIAGCPTSNKHFNSSVKHGTEIYKLSVQEKFLLEQAQSRQLASLASLKR
jgi:hypothetical protein